MVSKKISQSCQLGNRVSRIDAQQDDSVCGQLQTHDQLTKILVLGEKNPLIGNRQLQHCLIIATGRQLFDVDNIVTIAPQSADERHVTTLVRQ